MKEMTNGEVRSQDSSVERWILIGAREAAKAYWRKQEKAPLSIDCLLKYTSKCDVGSVFCEGDCGTIDGVDQQFQTISLLKPTSRITYCGALMVCGTNRLKNQPSQGNASLLWCGRSTWEIADSIDLGG